MATTHMLLFLLLCCHVGHVGIQLDVTDFKTSGCSDLQRPADAIGGRGGGVGQKEPVFFNGVSTVSETFTKVATTRIAKHASGQI